MTNDEMIAGRYLRWHKARKMVAFIVGNLERGRRIQINTVTHVWRFDRRHVGMFKATRTGAYRQRGKHWECIDYTAVQAY